MRAVVMREFGAPEVLVLEDTPAPTPGAGEVRVQVGAVEVSRTRDVAVRTGRHPFSREVALPHVLGGDCAGVVDVVGAGVDPGMVGRRVGVMNTHACGACAACRSGREYECPHLQMLGVHRWGSYAECTIVPVEALHRLPDDIDLVQAAALAATGPIALTQLRAGHVVAGTVVAVPGITGALATTVAALGMRTGARVVGLTRRPEATPAGLAACVLDSGDQQLEQAIRDFSDGAGLDCVIDNVAAPDVFDRYFPVLATGARVVVSGAIAAPELPVLRVPAAPLYVRSISLLGIRTATAAVTREFWALVRDGFRLPPELVHEYPLDGVTAAHRAITSGEAIAHTVLRVSDRVR